MSGAVQVVCMPALSKAQLALRTMGGERDRTAYWAIHLRARTFSGK